MSYGTRSSKRVVEFECRNDDCPTYVHSDERETVVSAVVYEGDTGAHYIDGPAEDGCPTCGEKLEVLGDYEPDHY